MKDTQYNSYSVPVSVKGIVINNGKVWLRYNQRDEWELPGGKMDPGEQPKETCKREMAEELGLEVEPIKIIQAHLYTIKNSIDESTGVLVVSYLCRGLSKCGEKEIEGEAGRAKFKLFSVDGIKELDMPDFYKEAIREAVKIVNG